MACGAILRRGDGRTHHVEQLDGIFAAGIDRAGVFFGAWLNQLPRPCGVRVWIEQRKMSRCAGGRVGGEQEKEEAANTPGPSTAGRPANLTDLWKSALAGDG